MGHIVRWAYCPRCDGRLWSTDDFEYHCMNKGCDYDQRQ